MRERRICACGRAALLARERGEHIARTTSMSTLSGTLKSSARLSLKRTVERMWRAQYAGSVASSALIHVPVIFER